MRTRILILLLLIALSGCSKNYEEEIVDCIDTVCEECPECKECVEVECEECPEDVQVDTNILNAYIYSSSLTELELYLATPIGQLKEFRNLPDNYLSYFENIDFFDIELDKVKMRNNFLNSDVLNIEDIITFGKVNIDKEYKVLTILGSISMTVETNPYHLITALDGYGNRYTLSFDSLDVERFIDLEPGFVIVVEYDNIEFQGPEYSVCQTSGDAVLYCYGETTDTMFQTLRVKSVLDVSSPVYLELEDEELIFLGKSMFDRDYYISSDYLVSGISDTSVDMLEHLYVIENGELTTISDLKGSLGEKRYILEYEIEMANVEWMRSIYYREISESDFTYDNLE